MNDLPADLTFEQQEGAVMTDNKKREKVIADILSFLTDCNSTPKQDVCISKQIAAYVLKEVEKAEARGMKKAAKEIFNSVDGDGVGWFESCTQIITTANKTLEAEGVIKP